MAPDRCRYTPGVRGDPELGRVSCWRPTYGDADRCIWHLEDGKSVSELARDRPEPDERLDGAVLRGLDLRDVDWLAGRVLLGADFTNANVGGADLRGTDLRTASFHDATARGTKFQGANLENADLRGADLRGADLTMARLEDTNLTDGRITRDTAFGGRVVYEAEMLARTDPDAREDALETAVRTYRTLERLSQDNSLYAQASQYYRKAKDVRRRFNWQCDRYLSALVAEVSRWLTGYGNRPGRVILASLGVILLAALAYPIIGGLHRPAAGTDVLYAVGDLSQLSLGGAISALQRSVFFSVVTFTTLGYGNLEPATTVGRYVAGLEALLGSILMALLVAVLTRSTWLR